MIFDCEQVSAAVDLCEGTPDFVPAGTSGFLIDHGGPNRPPAVVFTVWTGYRNGYREVLLDVELDQIVPA